MNGKKWIKIFSIVSFLSLVFVGGTNFIIDPLWSFNHTNKFNKIQLSFNERQQKTNDVYFNGLDKYDGILFGSSRTTYINQNDFQNMNIYNYAVNGMYPYEYEEYLKLAKDTKEKDFKYIIIGLDFFSSGIKTINELETPAQYIANTKSTLYRYKMLLSIDVLKKSIKTIKRNLRKKPNIYYMRNNVKYHNQLSEKERIKNYTEYLRIHTEEFIGDNYKKDKEYVNILKRIKKENPNTKFIIFTSAISADLLVSIIKNANKIKEFEKWLREIIEVFGEVHHFMTINSITTNLENYPDVDHLYPSSANLIANKLSGKKNSSIPKDFGVILNKNNIDMYMKDFKTQLNKYKNPLEF